MPQYDKWLVSLPASIVMVLRVGVWLLAILKLYEIVAYIAWVIRHGRSYRRDVRELIQVGLVDRTIDLGALEKIDLKHRVPWPIFWRLPRRLSMDGHTNRKLTQPLIAFLTFLGRWINRQPAVVLAVSATVLLLPSVPFSLWESYLILSLILTELLNLLFARGILGFIDNFRQDFTINPVDFHLRQHVQWSRTDFVGKFLLGISVFILTAIVGFAAVHFSVFIREGVQAYQGLKDNGLLPQIQFLYFSVVTAATVGYGDIYAVHRTAQIVAGLESLFTIGVVVLLLFTLSNTFSHEDY